MFAEQFRDDVVHPPGCALREAVDADLIELLTFQVIRTAGIGVLDILRMSRPVCSRQSVVFRAPSRVRYDRSKEQNIFTSICGESEQIGKQRDTTQKGCSVLTIGGREQSNVSTLRHKSILMSVIP